MHEKYSLSDVAKMLQDQINKNFEPLSGKFMLGEEVNDYYSGILRRQAIIHSDLATILKDRNFEYVTSPFILLRALMDDFIHLLYLELHSDRESEIVKINAHTHKQSFNSLQELTDSNNNYFNGQYKYYLTSEQLQKLKDEFAAKPSNQKYFTDPARFKFKSFMTFTQMAAGIRHSDEVEKFKDRAFYLWKHFSLFVHYSNFSFNLEIRDDPTKQMMIWEAFQYAYNALYLGFKYFGTKLGYDFINNPYLSNRFGIILP